MISCGRYGDMMTVYLGSRQIIYLNKYDVVKEAFVKHGNSFTGRPQDLLWSKDICQCIGTFLFLNLSFFIVLNQVTLTEIQGMLNENILLRSANENSRCE